MPTPIKATISGSSSATVLGLNKYQTPFEWWQNTMESIEPGFNSLQGYVLPDPFEGNASTRFGHAFESATIALTEEKIGFPITDRERVFSTIENEGTKHLHPLSCHVDGLIDTAIQVDGDGFQKRVLYEGKTTTQQAYRNGWDEEKNIIPRNYLLQVHHNMYLSGASEAIVSVLIFPETPDAWEEMGWEVDPDGEDYFLYREWYSDDKSEKFSQRIKPRLWARTLSDMGFHKIYRIPRNDELIDAMLEKYSSWWERHIIGRTAPEPMNVDDIKRMCPNVSGTIVIESGEVTDDMLKEDRDRIERGNALIEMMAEYKEIGKEIGKGGNLSKRRDQLKTLFLDGVRSMDKTVDDESTNKWIFRDSRGRKLGSWGKSANGVWSFR